MHVLRTHTLHYNRTMNQIVKTTVQCVHYSLKPLVINRFVEDLLVKILPVPAGAHYVLDSVVNRVQVRTVGGGAIQTVTKEF